MRCPSCDHDNRAARRFWAERGAALAARCAACGASNEPAPAEVATLQRLRERRARAGA